MEDKYSSYTIKELAALYRKKILDPKDITNEERKYIINELSSMLGDKKNGDLYFELFNKCVDINNSMLSGGNDDIENIYPEKRKFFIKTIPKNHKIKKILVFSLTAAIIALTLFLMIFSFYNPISLSKQIKDLFKLQQKENIIIDSDDYLLFDDVYTLKSFNEIYNLCDLTKDDLYISDEFINYIKIYNCDILKIIRIEFEYEKSLFELSIYLNDNIKKYFDFNNFEYLKTTSDFECYVNTEEKNINMIRNYFIVLKYNDLNKAIKFINEKF